MRGESQNGALPLTPDPSPRSTGARGEKDMHFRGTVAYFARTSGVLAGRLSIATEGVEPVPGAGFFEL